MNRIARIIIAAAAGAIFCSAPASAELKKDPKNKLAALKGLDWLAGEQHRQGYWEANGGQYRVAMTALSGNAMLAEGSTTTRGKYAKYIAAAVDYLLEVAQPNGLIGYKNDYHYTYGHGFTMLFLAIPMVLLFLISELIARFLDRRRAEKAPDREWDDDQASPL